MEPQSNSIPPDPAQLSRILSLQPESLRLWDEAELADVLRHQLDAPLLYDLGRVRAREGIDELSRGIGSFRELLLHPVPPKELLALTKEFAKSGASHPDSPVPAEVGTMLYYAAIAAALVRLQTRITTMTDAELHNGFEWGLQQSWIDPVVHRLLTEAEARLRASIGSSSG